MNYIGYFLFIASFLTCNKAANDSNAILSYSENYYILKLTGKRVGITHSPKDLIYNPEYRDTFLLYLPKISEGLIPGRDVLIEEGHYKYQGQIIMNKERVNIDLLVDDTDNHILRALSWNGEYKLIKSDN